jgi:serine/threonine protein kinase
MASSIESTFEKMPRPSEAGGIDSEKTVIRQGELLHLSDSVPGSVGSQTKSAHAPAEILLGKQLDHFLIESLVGTGGMGAVFRGRDLRLDRVVAIKVVPIADRDADAMRRFRFEAQSAAKLDHPNIARVYYVGETDEWSYIVFEFVEGTNLREVVMRQGPLSIDEAVGFTRQVAEALQHAFERKVVHRDIKPSNILVTQSGQAKVVDMGLARNTELDKSTNDLTASGVTLGTFDYISPEQAHDPRNADVRSDIYSLGCTLYFLVTGQPPFPDGTALQKLLLHGSKFPDDPRYFRSDISDSMISILRKMMAKKPIDRYQEPCDLIHDLRILSELEGLSWTPTSETHVTLSTASQRTWLEAAIPLLVSLAIIVGVGFWQWLHSISYQNAVFAIPREEIPDSVAISTKNPSMESVGDSKATTTTAAKSSVASGVTSPAVVLPSDANAGVGNRQGSEAAIQGEVVYVNPNAFLEKDRSSNVVRTMEQALDLVSDHSQLRTIVLRAASITTSLSGLRAVLSVESDITIQSEAGTRCKWIIEGAESQMESSDSLACMDCFECQLLLQDIDIEWRVSGMARRKALVAIRPGSWLQLRNSTITVQDLGITTSSATYSIASKRIAPLPAVVTVVEASNDSGEEHPMERSLKPARVTATQFSFRGQCDWMQLRSPLRTEVQLEDGWMALAGSMFDTTGSRMPAKASVPLRIELQEVTSFTSRAWMSCYLTNAHPYPIPTVRTAKDCIFSGCAQFVEWNATECPDWRIWEQTEQGQKIDRLIDLRGRDNLYDDSWMTHTLLVRMSNGVNEHIPLDITAPLMSDERGLETEAAWIRRPAMELSKMHEVTANAFDWMPRSFQPGFKPKH